MWLELMIEIEKKKLKLKPIIGDVGATEVVAIAVAVGIEDIIDIVEGSKVDSAVAGDKVENVEPVNKAVVAAIVVIVVPEGDGGIGLIKAENNHNWHSSFQLSFL